MEPLLACTMALMLAAQGGPIRQHYSYSILARIVDERGHPVANATIEVRGVAGDVGDDRSLSAYSNADGHICVGAFNSDLASPSRLVFVRGPVPPDSIVLDALCPAGANAQDGLCLPGRLVTIEKGGMISLGDIQVPRLYCATALVITDERDQPLRLSAEAWRRVRVRLRDERGDVVAEHSLSTHEIERCVDEQNALLRLALPSGAWTVETTRDDGRQWVTAGTRIVVHPDCDPLTIRVRTADPGPESRPN